MGECQKLGEHWNMASCKNSNYSFGFKGVTCTIIVLSFISQSHFNLSPSSSLKALIIDRGIVVLRDLPVDFALLSVLSNSNFIPPFIYFLIYKSILRVIYYMVFIFTVLVTLINKLPFMLPKPLNTLKSKYDKK